MTALLAAAFALPFLGHEPLADWDEAIRARAALQIARSGDWLGYADDESRSAIYKPPLHLWILAGMFKLLGPTELAARLYPAVCHILLVAYVTAAAGRHFKWPVALSAGFLLACDRWLVYQHGARSADLDTPLTLALTITVVELVRRRLAIAALAFAAAVMIKGVAAFQIMPVVLWAAWRWRRMTGVALATILLATAALPTLAVFAARQQREPAVLQQALQIDLWGRLTREVDGEPRPPWHYLPRLADAYAPVLLGLVLAAVAVRGRPRPARQVLPGVDWRELRRFLLIWWLAPLLAFSLAQTKRDWYLYPGMVPALVLAAWYLRAGLERLERARVPRWGPCIAAVVIGGVALPAAWRTVRHSEQTEQRRADDRLLAELTRTAADERGRVLLYRPYPSMRWVLDLERIPYVVVHRSDELSALGKSGRACLVLLPTDESAAVRAVLGDAVDQPGVAAQRRAWRAIRVNSTALSP